MSEAELRRRGFEIIKKIQIDGKDVYYKCITKYAQYVLVLISDKFIDTIPNISSEINIVSKSTKIGIMECLNSSVCGVAFECDDTYCILVQDDYGKLKEMSINMSKQYLDDQNDYLIYPVVLLHDIMTDPDQVNEILFNQNKIIKNEEYNIYMNLVDEMIENSLILTEDIELFHNKIIEFMDDNSTKIKALYSNIDKISLIEKKQMKKRSDFINNFLRVSKNFENYNDQLSRIKMKMENDFKLIKDIYETL